jgi:uncharacterized protein (DUF885 family)
MSRRLLLVCLVACLTACQPTAHTPEVAKAGVGVPEADRAFAALSARWLDESMRHSPVGATLAGDHRYDTELDDLSSTGRAAADAFNRDLLQQLERLDPAQLSRANQVDQQILRNQLQAELWNSTTFQSWAWNPLVYSTLAGNSLYLLMMRDFAPLPERLNHATARLEKLPQLLAQSRANLDPARVPRVHAETAALQNGGLLNLVDEMILPQADVLAPDARKRLDTAVANLRKAVAEHQTWLDGTLVPNARGDFRVGAQRFDEKLGYAVNSPLQRAEIRRRAEAELERVRAEMYTLSVAILSARPGAAAAYPAQPDHKTANATIAAALELAAAERPSRDKVIAETEAAVAETTAFVRAKNLITLPDSPLQIVLRPPFQAGLNLVTCEPPGPLEKHLPTFYTVSPIPEEWTPAQVESHLREYNTRSIRELTMHEAMPGHFVQMWHANRYASPLRAVLWSGPFVEGWAWYSQNMMVDEGYRGDDPLYRLVHLKWLLRGISNAIVDQMVHIDGISREDTLRFMIEETFQEEREAAGKWTRAQLEAAQLSTYFVGAEEWIALRQEAQRREGANFDLKRYHDGVLAFGAPPVRFARALYLNEAIR